MTQTCSARQGVRKDKPMKEIVQMLEEIRFRLGSLDLTLQVPDRGKSIRGISGKVDSMDLRSSLPSSAIY